MRVRGEIGDLCVSSAQHAGEGSGVHAPDVGDNHRTLGDVVSPVHVVRHYSVRDTFRYLVSVKRKMSDGCDSPRGTGAFHLTRVNG